MMQTEELPSRNLFPNNSDAVLNTLSNDKKPVATPPPSSAAAKGGNAVLANRAHGLPPRSNHKIIRRKSPSSVAAHPTVAQTITFSQEIDEVEVTLSSMSSQGDESKRSSPDLMKRDRAFDFPEARINSLLDVDSTPSPSPRKCRGLGLPMCCGMQSEEDYDDEVSEDAVSHQQIERTISKMLEEPDASSSGCVPWQTWSYFGVLDPVEEEVGTGGTSNDDVQRALRNRARNMKARKHRVQTMRRNLAPFSTASTPPKQPHEFYMSRSFDIKEHRGAIVRGAKNREFNGFAHILNSCTLPQYETVDSPVSVESYRDEEDCYDSDPEDFARRRNHSSLSGPNKENRCKQHPWSMSAEPTGSGSDALHERSLGSIVQDFMNETTTLILHPSRRAIAGQAVGSAPLAVNVWVERGQRLQTTIQPKLMWRQVHRARMNDARSVVLPVGVRGIELLDITRILKVGNIDRKQQPFAKPKHCFIIKTIDGEELFLEARSPFERNRCVHCLKLLVARFGAKVIVSDPSLFDEFFASTERDAGNPPEFL